MSSVVSGAAPPHPSIDTIDVSRPPAATSIGAVGAILGDVVFAALLVLVLPLALIVVAAAPFAVLGWALLAIGRLF
jgi:hypothetical protein